MAIYPIVVNYYTDQQLASSSSCMHACMHACVASAHATVPPDSYYCY